MRTPEIARDAAERVHGICEDFDNISHACDPLEVSSQIILAAIHEALKAENARLLQRAERAELLVRLEIDCKADVYRDGVVGFGRDFWAKGTTNGMPDLTDSQWERLFELERGGM